MSDKIRKDASSRMKKSVDALLQEFSKVRTGRAQTGLLDHVTAEYYGVEVPINQVSNISAEDARTLSINVWERSMVPVVEKAIIASDLGLNPSTAGQVIRIALPPLTEERRKELVKVVRNEAENARVAIRNIRRDANQSFKDMLKDKSISEDEQRTAEQAIQKLTDDYVAQVDSALAAKEKEMMAI